MKKITLFVMLVALCSTAFAGNLGLKSIAPKVGLAMPENLDTTFYLGVGVNMGELTDNLDLVPFLGFWSTGEETTSYEWSYSDFQLGADVHYMIESIEGLYAGGGLALHFMTSKIEAKFEDPYGYSLDGSTTDTKFGFAALSGYELPVAGKTAFAEVKYTIVDNFNTLEITVGVNFDL